MPYIRSDLKYNKKTYIPIRIHSLKDNYHHIITNSHLSKIYLYSKIKISIDNAKFTSIGNMLFVVNFRRIVSIT